MKITDLIDNIARAPDYGNQIVYRKILEAKEPDYKDTVEPIIGELRNSLKQLGIDRLYSHQADAVDMVRQGKNIVVVTSTASGKTLCYNIPVIESIIKDINTTAFYMFPTKALAQDQYRTMQDLLLHSDRLRGSVFPAVYDGDTPNHRRRKIRSTSNIIFTNPDMLHTAILPHHTKWSVFFQNLRYVVIDELHTYRGIFGSHVANLLRRLVRISNYYGSNPQYIVCSATISNPVEHASLVINKNVEGITKDGAPQGKKQFVFWNPPLVEHSYAIRKSPGYEAQILMKNFMLNRFQTITFTRTRLLSELIYRYLKEDFGKISSEMSSKIKAYRSGYLPEERREIEKELFNGHLLGVAATNALELGIDIGSLDAAIMVGYPGTISSTWQQAGRAGRTMNESLAVLIGGNDPIDQYFMKNPGYFFNSSIEQATIDPDNPYILASHLSSAAYELPLTEDDSVYFGKYTMEIIKLLEETGYLKRISDKWYWSRVEYPAAKMNLRTISDDTFSIIDKSEQSNIIGTMDSSSVPLFLHPGAVYLHQGELYLVEELNYNQKYAAVCKKDLNYFTRPCVNSKIKIVEKREEKVFKTYSICYGDTEVTWEVVSYSRVKFYTQENLSVERLKLPPETIETTSFWIMPAVPLLEHFVKEDINPVEGLVGMKNLLLTTLPVVSMCDKNDIGGVSDSTNSAVPTLYIYDKFRGGLGYAERGYGNAQKLFAMCFELINNCECGEGCPSCVGAPDLRDSIYKDYDGKGRPLSPDKKSTLMLLKHMITDVV